MDALIHDLRYVVRQLRAKPRFTLAVLATLALGLGANAAVFSLANWVVLRPIPGVHDQGRLLVMEFRDKKTSYIQPVSYPNLADLGAGVHALSGLAGHTIATPVAVQVDNASPRYLHATFISANYFDVLGMRLAAGRPITHDDEVAAAHAPVAVISDRLWKELFGGNAAVVGQSFTIDGARTRIVGVAPAGFRGTERLGDVDIWMPGSARAASPTMARQPMSLDGRGDMLFSELIGRLAPGATMAGARAQIQTAQHNLMAAYPKVNGRWTPATVFEGIGIPTQKREAVRHAMVLLGGIAGIVLLIACANVANLFLFRSMGRRTEWAVRKALGAPLGRLIRLQLTEALVLASLAAVPAVLLAVWLTGLFRGNVMPGLGAIEHIQLDWRVLAFTGAIALVTGIVSGLAPALASLRTDTVTNLKAGAAGVSRGAGWARGALATCQLAMSLSLLVVTFLLVGTVRNLHAVDVGFDADSVTTFAINPSLSGYSRGASLTVLQQSLQRIKSIPGVETVALSPAAPFMDVPIGRARVGDAAPTDSGIPATSMWVSADYFRALGIPLLGGRTFQENETFGPFMRVEHPVAILSRTLARRLFGNVNPVGRTVAAAFTGPPARVVGVVDDSRWGSLVDEGLGPMQYYPIPNVVASTGAVMLVRSSLPVSALRTAVQHTVSEVAPSVPIFDSMRLRQRVDNSMSEERLLARLLTAFTLLAVLLAIVGLYAVIAFAVAERTRELGIRIALGARSAQILTMIVRRGALLGGIGVVAGLAGAAGLSRLVESQLFGMSALEPGVYALAAALLLALVVVASIIPARHATRVDPVTALRSE
jgi:predicted permease